jgi:stage IV sporulation protein FB
MAFFQEPSHTRFDLRFNIAGIPIRVHPLFWLMTIFFGGLSGNPLTLLIWVAVVFVSILVHELGHALAMRFFGQPARVVLYLGGGLTIPDTWGNGSALTANEQIVMLLAGPGAGFLFGGLVVVSVLLLGGSVGMGLLYGFVPFPAASLPIGGLIDIIVGTILWVNIFWGFINLVPAYPLDGGQVARHLWLKADRWDGVRKSLWLSVVTGALMALVGLTIMQNPYIAILFGLLAFQSYQTLQGRWTF